MEKQTVDEPVTTLEYEKSDFIFKFLIPIHRAGSRKCLQEAQIAELETFRIVGEG